MAFIKNEFPFHVKNLSASLYKNYINQLNIFIIDPNGPEGIFNKYKYNNYEHAEINLLSTRPEYFIHFLNTKENLFSDYNKTSLYLIRSMNFKEIKYLFSIINDKPINLSKGSQKSHILSPLDFRLSFYLMAMSDFNYSTMSSSNNFNDLNKEKYLSWTNKPWKFKEDN